MKAAGAVLIILLTCAHGIAAADIDPLFVYRDGLAPRDEWGKLHRSKQVLPTDWERRYAVRFHYYFKGANTLQKDPAYVAAAQEALTRLGYHCGPIDGIYGPETADAVAQLQKNYGYQITGTLNAPVRRALYLP